MGVALGLDQPFLREPRLALARDVQGLGHVVQSLSAGKLPQPVNGCCAALGGKCSHQIERRRGRPLKDPDDQVDVPDNPFDLTPPTRR